MRKDEAGPKAVPAARAAGERRTATTTTPALDKMLAPLAGQSRPSKDDGLGVIEDAEDWRWVRT